MNEPHEAWKARYLDASAIVKLFVHERGSDVLRKFFDTQVKPFYTTSLCYAESFGVLKRKWLKPEGDPARLTTEQYLQAAFELTVARWGPMIEVNDDGLAHPFNQAKLAEIVTAHQLDISDALQLLTLIEGPHSGFVHRSSSVLITADRALARAARKMDVLAWNCEEEDPPEWA